MRAHTWTAILVAAVSSLTGAMGCATESYCFNDCDGTGSNTGGTGGSKFDGGDPDGFGFDSGTGGFIITPDSGPDARPDGCLDQELCNGLDDDCDGEIDEGIDYTRPQHCGTCANNCTAAGNLVNPSCTPPAVLDGTQPGTCGYERCADEFYDLDGNVQNGCEYYCIHNPDGTNTTDPGGAAGCGKDDDCDGTVDEDVNTCDDVENCGRCGKRCVIANGTAQCNTTAGAGVACTEANTRCEVDACDSGFYDVDGSPDNGCEYQCPTATPGPEICDGLDNDCDGRIDNADPDLETGDPGVGANCFGSQFGECATAAHQGVRKCIGGALTCCDTSSNDKTATNPNLPATGVRNGICGGDNPPFVLRPGDVQETCNGRDDDCDNAVDDNPTDAGGTCGSSVGSCSTGTLQCQSGSLSCQGASDPTPDICNGRDDNCDGVIDGIVATPAVPCSTNANCSAIPGATCRNNLCTLPAQGMGVACDVPPATPPGATSPCRAGTLQCLGGSPSCTGSITASATVDTCGVDANCDGTLGNQPDLLNDVRNCGVCGRDCVALAGGNGNWTCNAGTCTFAGCRGGFIDCSGSATDCETPCSGSSGNTELCNGIDDNCDCQVDNVLPANRPSSTQVCGVSPAATDPNCTTNVAVQCTAGSWGCTFPAGYCTGSAPSYCTNADNTCNTRDDNCNGTIDDDFQLAVVGPSGNYLGKDCFSDDGAASSHGVCRTQGTYICNSSNPAQTRCTAVKNNALASAELCDGDDNDCDGDVDETKNAPGTSPSYVIPAVRALPSGDFMYMYEASRPGATATNPETGNGWHTNPPSTDTADETLACSVPGVVPWFNVTPAEAAQTCAAVGGRLCELSDWQSACRGPGGACTRGYAPATACAANGNYPQGNPHCNIGLYDWDGNAGNGITDGLLPTRYEGGAASPTLTNCRADWSGTSDFYDIMGNLREITWNRSTTGSNTCTPENPTDPNCLFSLMGGAFNSQSEDGSSCDFTFYTVDSRFKLFDVGFRCCFDTNPQ